MRYDIIFISYNEPNAEQNWQLLLERFPYAKRIHGVKGIHNAHKSAAKMCFSNMFWVVDGDSTIVDNFSFELPEGVWEESSYVYKAENPINGLTYGNGGVKLLPRKYALLIDDNTIDMTTSLAPNFTAVDEVASVTNFNTDSFNTWRSAFRECVKLSSAVIDRQNYQETAERLNAWQTYFPDKAFAQEAAEGACLGVDYGRAYKDNPDALKKINDFAWLKEIYEDQITFKRTIS
jgi:hypothetical protein